MVYWLTGLPGAGKTTIGMELHEHIKVEHPGVVFLDGDLLRDVFGGIMGYGVSDRLSCSMIYSRLCKMLSEQGLIVICCTVSMFDSVRAWNMENISGYFEIYIKASFSTLRQRDQKKLYSGFDSGIHSQIIGLDQDIEEPKNPNIVIQNDGVYSVEECVGRILSQVQLGSK
ncbi:adenylyl-sulfate kinase [Paenibacillus sp. IHBB 10380]|uniref:adenylyl-sulfate kinase n=1 Tax=Paenibacillus sp. IHBB 10380 TaxID=1566358 RepID=UPI0005CFA6FD|nr:adenylyl-sulfate kinase [Paenibacillus sp. IHBB 10380]AJS57198.1 adenylylsulfate kinase [Paenibacillus sp. IHBB 10380]